MRVRSKHKISNMKRYKNYRLGNFVTLYHFTPPIHKFGALSKEDKYCFLLMGHIQNELSWLQRMAFISAQSKRRPTEVEKLANLMQTTFLSRLLLAKLFEFKKLIDTPNKPIYNFICKHFLPGDTATGKRQIETILAYYDKEEWIALARNKHLFHYPTLSDVASTVEDPSILWEAEVFHGMKTTNTFYPASDVLANYSWFRLANPNDPFKGFDDALKVITDLARLTIQTLEVSIGYFMDKELVSLEENTELKLSVPDKLSDIRLNYFVSLQ